jgi:hypothetical protein
MEFIPRHPNAKFDHFGYIPIFLSEDDPRPAREQFNERYVSGWRPYQGFKLNKDETLSYPGDPSRRPIAELRFRNERIVLYEHSWVAVIQPDGSWEVCRMD